MPPSLRTQNGLSLIEVSLFLALIAILVTFLTVSFRSTSQAAMLSKAYDIKQEIKLLTDSIYMQAMAEGQLGSQGNITHHQEGHPIKIPLKFGYPTAQPALFAFFYQDNPQIQIHSASQAQTITTPLYGQDSPGCSVEINSEILAIQIHNQIITYDAGFEWGAMPKIMVNPCLKQPKTLQTLSQKQIVKPIPSQKTREEMKRIKDWIYSVNAELQMIPNQPILGTYTHKSHVVTTKYGWLQAKSANFPKEMIGESMIYNKNNEHKLIERCQMRVENQRLLIIVTPDNEVLKYNMSTVKNKDEGQPSLSYEGLCLGVSQSPST